MNTLEVSQSEKLDVKKENVIHIPLGLLGFEQVKKYVLLSKPEEEPFMWLQMLEHPDQAFLVISPFLLFPEYRPDLSREDAEFLNLACPEDSILLNIVTLRPGGQSTVNLKGPVVLNRKTLIGKQVILNNAAQYLVQQPMPGAV